MSKVIVDTLENTAGTFTSAIDSLGPSTTAGAVGTHAFARTSNGNAFDAGATLAGSTLSWSNANGLTSNTPTISGTWRLLGRSFGSYNTNAAISLWVRIS